MTDAINSDAPESPKLTATAVQPSGFQWGVVNPEPGPTSASPAPDAPPPLNAIADFTHTWVGSGFNTIFRPQAPPKLDNLLELNLTRETLSFSPSLGTIPNRGMVQADVFMNGIPYLQSIDDVTDAAKPVGIHVEPGVWLAIPETTNPPLGQTYARMGSIPHGTTIIMQGTSTTASGKPTIPSVDITPTKDGSPVRFSSQTAATPDDNRIPADLGPFIAVGTITQAMLDDPNEVLRSAIAGQTITETTTIELTTDPAAPLFGGGEDNIAFLLGNQGASAPNAQVTSASATFWIETVTGADGISFKQIQYSQTVLLNFNGVIWPHVSVATLRPLAKPAARAFQRVAAADTTVGTQYVAVGDGHLWHSLRSPDASTQSGFTAIETSETNNPGEFTSVAVAGIGDQLHVVGLAEGQLWHTIRSGDGTWQNFFGSVGANAGNDPGVFVSGYCSALSSGDLQVTGVANGNLWFAVRHSANGAWAPFQLIQS